MTRRGPTRHLVDKGSFRSLTTTNATSGDQDLADELGQTDTQDDAGLGAFLLLPGIRRWPDGHVLQPEERAMKAATGSMTTGLVLVAVLSGSAAMAQNPRRDDRRPPPPHEQQRPEEHRGVSQQEQQRRVAEERARQASYQRVLDQRMRAAQLQQAQLQTQRRTAQYALQQQYLANLQAQRQRVQAQRDYNNDPYFAAAPVYRYRYGSNTRQTNQYGADVLKQAVNYGYDQGVQAGRADRQDGRASSYRSSFAYQDANYGYAGQYVPQSDYNYYFREGFRRGYTDGYASTTQFGSFNNGAGSILGTVLSSILSLTNLR